jgi:hypothetical protein
MHFCILLNSVYFFISGSFNELGPPELDIKILEAGQVRLLLHDYEQVLQVVDVLLEFKHASDEECAKVPEEVGVLAPHELDILLCELEWSSFKVYVAGRASKHKSKINVNDTSHIIDEYVTIMPILDVHEIGEEGIAGKGFNEVLLCFL